MDTQVQAFKEALRARAPDYQVTLREPDVVRLGAYYELVTRWNPRLHLVGPCSPEEFATRHVLESLLLVSYLPDKATLVDIGSGAGLPIVPVLVLRSDVRATLFEAAKKKAVFLREALKVTETSAQAVVMPERFEASAPPAVDFVTCRALERFEDMLPTMLDWSQGSRLLLFGGEGLAKELDRSGVDYDRLLIPRSKKRFLYSSKSE